MLPLSRGDMRADTVLSWDAELRDVLQKQGLAVYKKAKGCVAALQKYLSSGAERSEKGKNNSCFSRRKQERGGKALGDS